MSILSIYMQASLTERSLYEQNERLESKCEQLEQQVLTLQKSPVNSKAVEQVGTCERDWGVKHVGGVVNKWNKWAEL